MGKDVIIACDFASGARTLRFLEQFGSERPFVKIGMELFYSAGPTMVRALKDRGHKVFLDLKLCDIPNTVGHSMRVLRDLGADMINVHAFGTIKMMEAALEGLTRPDGTHPLLIAVTQLTSTDEARMQRELLIDRPLEEVVLQYAANARAAGLDGVVCSPLESPGVHARCGDDFLTVTPGVRFAAANPTDDQVRITTPAQAKALGSNYIVVGRPITKAEDPVAAYHRVLNEFTD